MSRSWVRYAFSLFVALALYISVLLSARNHTTMFFAFMTFGWHALANVYCSLIASYRFKNPEAKYIKIENKVVRKLFVRRAYLERVPFKNKSDERTNVIGLVLNIINCLLFVFFEILLILPKIPSEPYTYRLPLPTRRHHYEHIVFELHSYNEIIVAEGGQAFALLTGLIFLVFIILFARQLKEHRRKIERNTVKTPRMKPFKKIEWYSPLYHTLVDLADHRNNKKHKFWYDAKKLEQIENIVKSASENAELKLETRGRKLVSFTVTDTLNNCVRFTGYFIYNKR